MHLGRVDLLGSSFSNESSKSVSVANAGRFLDGSRHVVVVMTKLVREQLNLVRTGSRGIFDNSELAGCVQALFGSDRDQVELVEVVVGDTLVDHSTWDRVLEVANVSSEESGVNSLVDVQVNEFRVTTSTLETILELLNFISTDSRDLRV